MKINKNPKDRNYVMVSNIKCGIDNVQYNYFDNKNYLLVMGWILNYDKQKDSIGIKVNGKEFHEIEVVEFYDETSEKVKYTRFFLKITKYEGNINNIQILIKTYKKLYKTKTINTNSIKENGPIIQCIEDVVCNKSNIVIKGWVYSLVDGEIKFKIKNSKDNLCEFSIQKFKREDIDRIMNVKHKEVDGFVIECNAKQNETFELSTEISGFIKKNNIEYKTNLFKKYFRKVYFLEIYKILFINKDYKLLIKKILSKLKRDVSEIDYSHWCNKTELSNDEFSEQKSYIFKFMPKICMIIFTSDSSENNLVNVLNSLLKQSYNNLELSIIDSVDSGCAKELLGNEGNDQRIKVIQNSGDTIDIKEIISNLDADYVGVCDSNTIFSPNAIFEFVKVINSCNNAEMIYCDEDKIDLDSGVRFRPYFKTDFNIELLRCNNYIGNMVVVKKDIFSNIKNYNYKLTSIDAFIYDYIFRCIECIVENNIYHVSKVLFHNIIDRNNFMNEVKVDFNRNSAMKKAIENHYKRNGEDVEVFDNKIPYFYQTKIELKDKPLISIVIPNKDHIDDLDKCLNSIITKSTYSNYEIIIIENNSVESKTFEYYKKIKNDRIKIVKWDGDFNYSAINNYGIKYSKGEFLLLLNNDTEVINPEWLEEMLVYCERDDVGIVGAKLLYPDKTIQHAGVIVGINGVAGHTFLGLSQESIGYFGHLICTMNYSAVTAACLMVKRSVFFEVDGLDERFKVAYNDIDFCLRVREKGYSVVYNPKVELFHYESKSRGLEDTRDKIKRYNSEVELFRNRWNEFLKRVDPFYNENFDLNGKEYTLKL